MINLRVTATAYLMNNEDILLMKRSISRKFAPGIWAGVGGHLEPHEISKPEEACFREIFEETALEKEDLEDLKLKYIILRRCKEEIRIQYVYFGYSRRRNVSQTDEGELFWVDKKDIFEKDLSVTTRETLKHYTNLKEELEDILVGTVSAEDNRPVMNWIPVQDWEGML